MDSPVFPFGQPLRIVQQIDRAAKRVFILSAYASAVHARWVDRNGEEVAKALAVASEPYLFWRGDGAAEIIRQIDVPPALGKLEPADRRFNGPSGVALDEFVLEPLGLKREQVWLCNLVPHSCVNSAQQDALKTAYLPLVGPHGLPMPSVPPVATILADETRRREIVGELKESQAQVLITLGDEPLGWFLRHFTDLPKRLAYFESYGRLHPVQIEQMPLTVVPLAHPRQVARLGTSSPRWSGAHRGWMKVAADSRLRKTLASEPGNT